MKENKGFTLPEMIVVKVIIAILIGATITGIYMYVKKAKINTDIANCKTYKEVIQGIEDNTEFYRNLVKVTPVDSKTILYLKWGKARESVPNANISFVTGKEDDGTPEDEKITNIKNVINSYMKQVYSEGLPAPRSKGECIIAIGIEKDANRQIKIKADSILVSKKNIIKYSDDESRIGQELTEDILVW